MESHQAAARARRKPPCSLSPRSVRRERMRHAAFLRHHFGRARFAVHRALDRLARGLVVVLLNLLVVLRLPVNEHAHAQEQVVGFGLRDRAVLHAVRHRERDRVLRRSEHLHGLARALDRHFVEQDRVRLGEQVRCDDCKQRCEAILIVGERVAKCGFRSRTSRSDQQVDVRDFVAIADERLSYQDAIDLGHAVPPMNGLGTCRLSCRPGRRRTAIDGRRVVTRWH
ncbi:hypothetical protein PUN4_390020 [Paraburkholderia unamae]|nr:hypothetical protein PUN4_390020 [Paraburkholderia unamae]